ncbi:MAG: hypothetical protein AAF403_01860 [Pseudomonadota bacterium]
MTNINVVQKCLICKHFNQAIHDYGETGVCTKQTSPHYAGGNLSHTIDGRTNHCNDFELHPYLDPNDALSAST